MLTLPRPPYRRRRRRRRRRSHRRRRCCLRGGCQAARRRAPAPACPALPACSVSTGASLYLGNGVYDPSQAAHHAVGYAGQYSRWVLKGTGLTPDSAVTATTAVYLQASLPRSCCCCCSCSCCSRPLVLRVPAACPGCALVVAAWTRAPTAAVCPAVFRTRVQDVGRAEQAKAPYASCTTYADYATTPCTTAAGSAALSASTAHAFYLQPASGTNRFYLAAKASPCTPAPLAAA